MFSTDTPVPTTTPSTVPAITIVPSMTTEDTGWSLVQPGLEERHISVIKNDTPFDEYLIVRVDPDHFRFEIHYESVNAKGLGEWALETGAQVVVNGAYFERADEQYLPTGLFIVNGNPRGESFGDYAGMFTVDGNTARLRWLRDEPYSNESHQFALQSFPMLVKPGGQVGFPAEYEDNIHARRTVIALDRTGRFIFFASGSPDFSLHQLSHYLAGSDLDIDVAVNLDGGPSTGLFVSSSGSMIPSEYDLPIVITVHSR